MYNISLALDTNRNRAVDTDISRIRDAVSKREFKEVFSVKEKITGDIFKVFENLIYQYEIFRTRSGLGREASFSLGDKIVLENVETGETMEVIHCLSKNGYEVL